MHQLDDVFVAFQATTAVVEGAEAAAAMLSKVAAEATVAATMATMPMEATITEATGATAELPLATMVMVSVFNSHSFLSTNSTSTVFAYMHCVKCSCSLVLVHSHGLVAVQCC